MSAQRTLTDIKLVCEDRLPRDLIPTKGLHFTLSWSERLENKTWTHNVKHMGIEARTLIGRDWFDPAMLRAMGCEPHSVVVVPGPTP